MTNIIQRKSLLPKTLLRKIGKGWVNKNPPQNGSKECACPTRTPCKGLRPVDPTPSAQLPLKVLP